MGGAGRGDTGVELTTGRAADTQAPCWFARTATLTASSGPLTLARSFLTDQAVTMASDHQGQAGLPGRAARLPPRWFVVAFWHGHRALLRATGGRVGLWRPRPGRWGALWLTTAGRRSGRPRQVVVGYFEDGPNLVTMAMNGWGPSEPAWWLNLQAHPDAIAQTRDGVRQVHARSAQGEERDRLWARWAEIDKNLDGYAARRPTETAVVVLEPRDTGESDT
jgi:deazaflavin-dependent oxidoreductase (nitroreductase family)